MHVYTPSTQAESSPAAKRKMEGSSDLERLQEIFFEITECKDDSQQRGWAVHDDEQAITEILEELLQILVYAHITCIHTHSHCIPPPSIV